MARMKMPEDRFQIAKAARCRPEAIRLINVRPGRRSWRIPIYSKEGASVLWCPEHGTVENTPQGMRAYRKGDEHGCIQS